ncbi:MAG: DUF29 domain-containing protein [Alphaproteobacteria bacterium]|nr:DUF29 domain-containing protein [Alphaproteobacteria bacterium]
MSDLYDTDVLTWSERQAALLRRVAAGERVNDQVDWEHVAEEVESVGRSQVDVVESLLTQILAHRLKEAGWPASLSMRHWQKERRVFARQARRKFTESMRGKLDLDELHGDALLGLPDDMDGQPPQPVSQKCPWTIDELLSEA